MAALADAPASEKAELYAGLGLELTYHPMEQRVIAEARPGVDQGRVHEPCRRGEHNHRPTRPHEALRAVRRLHQPEPPFDTPVLGYGGLGQDLGSAEDEQDT